MSFEQLGLSADLLRAISEQGYNTATPIQQKAIPLVVSGKDVVAGAQTGTGKTAAFTLPILHQLGERPAPRGKRPVRALVLTPTRELAAQIGENTESYGKYTGLRSTVIFGGVKINPQISQLQRGVDILIATPGRLLDHAQQGTLSLADIEMLVLDEADRMLDMGFIHDIRKILALLPDRSQRQNLLFSATFSREIKQLAGKLMNSPEFVEVAAANATADKIEQVVHRVAKSHKRALLSHLISTQNLQQVLVFTRTKHGANRLAQQLEKDGIQSAAIHGNKSQGARTRALAGFKNGNVRVLVATDIAARGLDISQLPNVVNYELPNVPEDYVHRIGRTARAGRSGEAVSLVEPEEVKLLKGIERLLKRDIPQVEAEGFDPASVAVEPERSSGDRQRKQQPRDRNKSQGQQRSRKPANGNSRNSTSQGGNSQGGNSQGGNSQHSNQHGNQQANGNTVAATGKPPAQRRRRRRSSGGQSSGAGRRNAAA